MVTRAVQKAEPARRKALVAHVQQHEGALDPASLARSYGLPVAEVIGIISRNQRRAAPAMPIEQTSILSIVDGQMNGERRFA